MEYPKSDYKEYPKTLARNDFWGQVRRSQFGKRISETEIQTMVEAIRQGLALQQSDIVLDLACGNGALSVRLFSDCAGWLGVDFSAYLIEIAQENFERLPDYTFETAEVCEYARSAANPERFTCGLCYGSFSYLPVRSARELLQTLHRRFTGLDRLFLGNLPDKDRASLFYAADKDYAAEIAEHTAQIGIWWSEAELRDLAEDCGWTARLSRMPPHVFNAKYRFDAILRRKP
jgi:cyclopropane fatty-acyl-phospholipid synthase-like methyltransferase